MAAHTQKGGVTINAFQWLNTTITAVHAANVWAASLSMSTPDGRNLHVQCYNGTLAVPQGDWVVQQPNGEIVAMSAAQFTQLYS